MRSKDFSKCVVFVLEGHRRKQNLSQSQLAFKVGLSKSDISHLEIGRKELKILELSNICEALNLKIESVLLETKTTYSKLKKK
jgi:transcriptional regulator with XRE-family HTH domain